jgi:hypothetical protein
MKRPSQHRIYAAIRVLVQEEVRATVISALPARWIAPGMSEITKNSVEQKDVEAEVDSFRKDLSACLSCR